MRMCLMMLTTQVSRWNVMSLLLLFPRLHVATAVLWLVAPTHSQQGVMLLVVLQSGNRLESNSLFFKTWTRAWTQWTRTQCCCVSQATAPSDFCINRFVNVASTDNCRLVSNVLLLCCYFSPHAQIVNTEFYERSVSSNSLDLDLNPRDSNSNPHWVVTWAQSHWTRPSRLGYITANRTYKNHVLPAVIHPEKKPIPKIFIGRLKNTGAVLCLLSKF